MTRSNGNLTVHWFAVFAYFAVLFGLAFFVLVIGFWRRLNWRTIALAGLNVATAWVLNSLYFITSDPLAHPALVQIGLAELRWVFLVGGAIWSVVALFELGREIDASKRQNDG